ncbi:MAG TPA: ABC transporter ATP-binding protein, partial [Candidatus Megaira endosymbiont of Hartmannula sinica]|nr:ABC transporter ATP-binding protein [Candidatus Megaera endosymbiont of Hartmannula sinica]
FILMAYYSLKLLTLVVALIMLIIFPIILLSKKIRKLSKQILTEESNINYLIDEHFSNIKIIKSYNIEDYLQKIFFNQVTQYYKFSNNRVLLRSLFFCCVLGAVSLSILLIILVGINDIKNGIITAGTLVSFLYYALISSSSLIGIAEIITEFHKLKAAIDRIKSFLKNTNDQIINNSSYENLDYKNIIFNNVSFSYPSRKNINILNNISFNLESNKFNWLIGKSGCGKTSIIYILMNFYRYNQGYITLQNGHNIKNINYLDINTVQKFARDIAYIPQNPSIFSTTIRENILIGGMGTNMKKKKYKVLFEEIVKICNIDNIIRNLDTKLDTEIGEKGSKLSAGQKQRISIARALIKISLGAKILVIDEGTSNLDIKSEENILNAIRKLFPNIMVIAITHRVNSIRNGEKVIYINNGSCEKEIYYSNSKIDK